MYGATLHALPFQRAKVRAATAPTSLVPLPQSPVKVSVLPVCTLAHVPRTMPPDTGTSLVPPSVVVGPPGIGSKPTTRSMGCAAALVATLPRPSSPLVLPPQQTTSPVPRTAHAKSAPTLT